MMKNMLSKLFLVSMLFCASGFAFAVTTLNANSTQDEVNAAIDAAGPGGYEALALELAEAHVPTQFILNAVTTTYGVSGLQVVVNSFAAIGMDVAQLNAAATSAIVASGGDPATSGFTPATGAGGGGGRGTGGGTGGGTSFTPTPCSGVSAC